MYGLEGVEAVREWIWSLRFGAPPMVTLGRGNISMKRELFYRVSFLPYLLNFHKAQRIIIESLNDFTEISRMDFLALHLSN